MDLNKKKVLVTGGAGFIGSNLVMAIQEKYPEAEITVADNLISGDFRNLDGYKGDFIVANIVNLDLEKYFPSLDIIFHQAAITETIFSDSQKMIFENVEGFRNVLNYALSHNTDLVYASASGIYGQSPIPMKVGAGEIPLGSYTFSKLVADNIARRYFDLFEQRKKKLVGLRYFIVYGPREDYKISETKGSIILKLYLQMKKGERPILFGDGEQKRDFVYVKDVVNANFLALEAKRNGIFNIGVGKAVTFNEVVNTLNKSLGTNLEPIYQENPFQKTYQYNSEADITETKEVLGYKPEYALEQGIKDYLKP